MPIPNYQTLMLLVLRLAAESETPVPEVEARFAADYELTLEERSRMLPSGGRVLQNRTYWAKFYLTKAGLLTRRGAGASSPARPVARCWPRTRIGSTSNAP